MSSRKTRFTAAAATRAIIDNVFNDSDSENDMLATEHEELSDFSFSDGEGSGPEDSENVVVSDVSEAIPSASDIPQASSTPRSSQARRTTKRTRRPTVNSVFEQDSFKFTDKKGNNWTGSKQTMPNPQFTGTPGNAKPASDLSSPLAWVRLFLTDVLIAHFVLETNRYASQYIAKQTAANLNLSYRVSQWTDVTIDEMWTFIGLFIATGLVKKGRLEDYWSTDSVLDTPFFREHMARNRFQVILRFFHFADNQNLDTNDPLAKIRPVYDLLCSTFTDNYTPEQHLALDEGTLAWRGRLKFKVYNPMKPDKYGIKGYIVSEAATGYLWRYDIYCGAGKSIQDRVLQLLEPAKHQNYFVYMDNFYNSVALLLRLLQEGIYAAGTLRANRGQPSCMEAAGKVMKKGDSIYAYTDSIVVVYWTDKRLVKLISSMHIADMVDSPKLDREGNPIKKPFVVLEYNKYMNGVDKSDQMLKYFPMIRGTLKWTVKFVFYFLKISLFNASVLFKKHDSCSDLRSFLLSHVKEIMQKHSRRSRDDSIDSSTGNVIDVGAKRSPYLDLDNRLLGAMQNHQLIDLPPKPKRAKPTHVCYVCFSHGLRRETRMVCKQCNVPLHSKECYTAYHTKKNY